MKSIHFALAAAISVSTAQVIGQPFGFAKDVTGGDNAPVSRPQTNEELLDLLTRAEPAVIVIDKTFEFVGSEGEKTETGCAPWGTGDGCQLALDGPNWCGNNPPVEVTYDVSGTNPIRISSNKTLVGEGTNAAISGKGLHFQDVENIIVQNIHITNLNPQYVWGGDALTLWGSDLVWIDHVRISLVGRQHIVTGFSDNTRQTWSNMWFDGETSWSATCNGHHYWGFLLVGEGDQITFANNYVSKMSGRGPSLGGGTVFHAVNTVWEENPGYALEGGGQAKGLFEGCAFKDVALVAGDNLDSDLFFTTASNGAQCEAALGRPCEANSFDNSLAPDFERGDWLDVLSGVDIPPVIPASEALTQIPSTAGNTLAGSGGKETVPEGSVPSSVASAAPNEQPTFTSPAAPPTSSGTTSAAPEKPTACPAKKVKRSRRASVKSRRSRE